MKLLLIALTLTPAAAFSSSSSELYAMFGDKHDAQAVMGKLTNMMGAAQQKLGLAERHHKKVVKKVRKEAAAFLEQESNVYGKYLNSYSAELTQASEVLQNAVNSAKAALAKAEAAPSNPNDWKDPQVEQRAKLGAQVAAAERTLKRSERKRVRQVREAEERAEENMEDESQKLGMKLGDMTPLVDEAKKTLETVAEKPVVMAAGKTAASDTKKVDLKVLQNEQDNLKKAASATQAKTTDANKRLDGFLTKTGKEVAEKTTKIQGDLDAAQKEEIEKVLGRKQAPVKPVPATKKAEKPAPQKAVKAKAATEVKPAKAAVAKK